MCFGKDDDGGGGQTIDIGYGRRDWRFAGGDPGRITGRPRRPTPGVAMCQDIPSTPKGTRKWYEGQEAQMTDEEKRRAQEGGGAWRGPSGWQGDSGWHPRMSVGARYLMSGRIREWFRWVFVDLDRHQADCRWRRLCTAVTR